MFTIKHAAVDDNGSVMQFPWPKRELLTIFSSIALSTQTLDVSVCRTNVFLHTICNILQWRICVCVRVCNGRVDRSLQTTIYWPNPAWMMKWPVEIASAKYRTFECGSCLACHLDNFCQCPGNYFKYKDSPNSPDVCSENFSNDYRLQIWRYATIICIVDEHTQSTTGTYEPPHTNIRLACQFIQKPDEMKL